MRHPKLFSFIAALGLGACVSAFAQTTSPLPGPFPADPTPKPFDYPQGLSTPQFTLEQNPASVIQFGDFPIVLGVTPLSVVTRAFGGSLHHLPDRTDYLCYSAPIQETPKPKKKAKKKPAEDEVPPPEVIGQDIWFIIGERGEVTEAKAEAVTTEGELCPALPEAFSNVSFGPFRIGVNLKPREIKKLEIPEPSVAEEDSPWRYWFATNKESHPIHYGFFAVETDPEFGPKKMISTELEFRGASL